MADKSKDSISKKGHNILKMFDMGASSKVRGSGHLILNALRALTLVALLAVMVASWIMVVFSGITGQLFFFDMISHIFLFFIAVFLSISEVGLFKKFYTRNWPVLSPSHSLAWLGVAMIMVGCDVLGNLNKQVYSISNLGLPIWRMVLAAGILSIIFGFLNIIVSIIFRDGKNGINARQIRSDGNLAEPVNKENYYEEYPRQYAHSEPGSSYSVQETPGPLAGLGKRAKRATQFMSGGWRKSRPQISNPIIVDDVEPVGKGQWSDESRSSPISPNVQYPQEAHPANRAYSAAYMPKY